ncbi:MAG: hypothetical protein QM831_40030 [Kofleriaceae bacterium]
MRTLVLVALLACDSGKKPVAPPPAPVPAPVVVVADGAAAPALIELLHNTPVVVRLSSQVQNAAIKPEHIVDHDFNTAWNSRTNEMEGSWIEITLPAGVTAEQIKLTAGHTGKGPKGEDYFTMNPRITQVSVMRGSKLVGRFPLDPNQRGLQTLAVHAQDTLRIYVDKVKLGSKKTWRETCVSELEVWGTVPPGFDVHPSKPVIEVEPPPPPPTALDKLCDGLDAAHKEWELRIHAINEGCRDASEDSHCGVDPPGEPSCNVETVVSDLEKPWQEVAIHDDQSDSIYHIGSVELLVRVDDGLLTVDELQMMASPASFSNVTAKVDHKSLIVDYDANEGSETTHRHKVCTPEACK